MGGEHFIQIQIFSTGVLLHIGVPKGSTGVPQMFRAQWLNIAEKVLLDSLALLAEEDVALETVALEIEQ